MRTIKPTTALELEDAIDEACERELSAFTPEELFELRNELLKEASRIGGPQGSRDDLRRTTTEEHVWRLAVMENANAVEHVLARIARRQRN